MAFNPGKVIKEFTTKSGKPAIIRYPTWQDVADLLKHINTVSKEDTFITFSGEQETLESEAKYLASEFVDMETGKAVKLFCYVDGIFDGVCDIHQNQGKKERGKHVATFGLVVGRDFRGDGIGFALSQATIAEAKMAIQGLRLIYLDCFANNIAALTLYAKLGFTEAGRIPQGLLYKGEYVDEVHMALTTV